MFQLHMYCLPSDPLLSQDFVYILYSVLYRVSPTICSPIGNVSTVVGAIVVGQVCFNSITLLSTQTSTVQPEVSVVVSQIEGL